MSEKATTVAEFVAKYGVEAEVVAVNENPNMEDPCNMHHYQVFLDCRGETMETHFSQGYARTKPPTVEDVLMCLMSDAQSVAYGQTFEDWAGELGYDEDSRKAERTFKAVTKQYTALEQFLGATMLRELLGCEE